MTTVKSKPFSSESYTFLIGGGVTPCPLGETPKRVMMHIMEQTILYNLVSSNILNWLELAKIVAAFFSRSTKTDHPNIHSLFITSSVLLRAVNVKVKKKFKFLAAFQCIVKRT